jgi:peptidoglycan-associated lipoprotein
MRARSRLGFLLAVAVLIGGLALWGCAKQPVVTGSRPPSVTPGPATSPGGAPGAAGPSAGEVPVARPTPPTETPISQPPAISSSALPAAAATAPGASPLKDVFFEYDKAVIEGDQRTALNDNVRWLKSNANAKILLEGHCDERGTSEYNLGLGDRRAKAVRDFLITAGVAPNRIGTISYGKERPFAFGHDERAWKQNRRVHFALQGS